MDVDWNADKAESNREKHGVSFEEAASVLGDELAVTYADPFHSVDIVGFALAARGLQPAPNGKIMKMNQDNTGSLSPSLQADEDGLLPDYGGLLKNGVRGKHAGKITHINGRPEPVQRLVTFSPEVAAAFPTDDAINDALRSLLPRRGEETTAS